MIYERGNAAKQWIFEALDQRFGSTSVRILDLASGSGRLWEAYLATHPATRVIGIDTDAKAIEAGKKKYAHQTNISLHVLDAQKLFVESDVDAVVAFSAIEHVVDREAFLSTVWKALKSGGVAYMNYDAGHFRSSNWKERFMVPASQLLAKVGFEGSYMKRVNDALFRSQAEKLGFRILGTTKHNLHPMKGFMRGASDQALNEWFAYEETLRRSFPSDVLDSILWSTTLTIQKP